jgi:hypothetical protein
MKVAGGATGAPPNPPTGGHDVDIATIKTHMGWIVKGLAVLASLCLLGASWAFANIYQPMQTLVKDSAVQTIILGVIKDDLKDLKSELIIHHDKPEASPRKR